ncbi:hypothetical protein HYT25_04120 [Candidatus Pacearchaeota archaeon]|nr:hypothetical protein [Candidatus Pacearchaeota archaeon]
MPSAAFARREKEMFEGCKTDITKLLKEREEINSFDITNEILRGYDPNSLIHLALKIKIPYALAELRRSGKVTRKVRIQVPYLYNMPLPSFIPAGSRNTFYSLS